ncbi:MAG: alkyl hydroperoxide reductase [Bacteroidetes bacterium 4572_77]|nr:MAG: alkyl hydroperoxide reductase [Bacteroidetes bacterium 4572_77]
MRRLAVTLSLLLFSIVLIAQNASKKTLPNITVKTITGESFNTADIENDGNPIIVSFWALWCHPCIKELTTIADVYEDWQEDTGVKLYAISIDDARSTAKVGPLANGKGWEYEILLDPNGDFKRAMNVNQIPHTFVLDGNKNIVWQHTSFAEGAELDLIEIVEKVKKGEDISKH